MGTDPYDIGWMSEQTAQVIHGAVELDRQLVADALTRIVERYGGRGVYGLCCALAQAFACLSGYSPPKEGSFYGLRVRHLDRG